MQNAEEAPASVASEKLKLSVAILLAFVGLQQQMGSIELCVMHWEENLWIWLFLK